MVHAQGIAALNALRPNICEATTIAIHRNSQDPEMSVSEQEMVFS